MHMADEEDAGHDEGLTLLHMNMHMNAPPSSLLSLCMHSPMGMHYTCTMGMHHGHPCTMGMHHAMGMHWLSWPVCR